MALILKEKSQHTCFDLSDLCKAQRICHSQVSVQWDTAEEGDADVDVSVEDEAEQFAALLTVDPVIVLQEVVDPQRKSDDVEEVGHGQVDQVDAKLIALLYLDGGIWRRWDGKGMKISSLWIKSCAMIERVKSVLFNFLLLHKR